MLVLARPRSRSHAPRCPSPSSPSVPFLRRPCPGLASASRAARPPEFPPTNPFARPSTPLPCVVLITLHTLVLITLHARIDYSTRVFTRARPQYRPRHEKLPVFPQPTPVSRTCIFMHPSAYSAIPDSESRFRFIGRAGGLLTGKGGKFPFHPLYAIFSQAFTILYLWKIVNSHKKSGFFVTKTPLTVSFLSRLKYVVKHNHFCVNIFAQIQNILNKK